MKLRPKIKTLMSLLVAALLLSLYVAQLTLPGGGSRPYPAAVRGTLDLSEWDFSRSGNVKLDGEWAFIPDRLAGFDDWPLYEAQATELQVPSSWNAAMDAQHPRAFGHGTYRLRVLLPAASAGSDTAYGYRSIRILTSHKVLIRSPSGDGGGDGIDLAVERPRIMPHTLEMPVSGDSLDIIVQVSNFTYGSSGGITLPITFGLAADVYTEDKLEGLSDVALAVITLLHALIAILLYVSQRSHKHLLYFALLHLFGCLYILSTSERLLPQMVPEMTNEIGYRLIQIGTYGLLYFCYQFIHSLYPEFSHPVMRRAMQVMTIPGMMLACFLDVRLFSAVDFFRMVVLLVAVLCILYVIVRAVLAYEDDAPYLLITGTAMLSVGLADIMMVINVQSAPMPPIDQAVFLIGLMLLAVRKFVQTSRRLGQLSIQNEQMKNALLQAQIKPHFLFNSLNTIGSLVETDPPRAQDLIAEFSNYLRYSFDLTSTRPLVPFEREWAMVEAYLSLEQARYEDLLQVRSEVSAAFGCMLPPLTLQPLVENAIRHGLMRRHEGGCVSIRAERRNGVVDIEVADDGVGMPDSLVDIVRRRPLHHDERREQSGTGIGLHNIHQRLLACYGDGLSIVSRMNGGTVVSFRIPARAKESSEHGNLFAD